MSTIRRIKPFLFFIIPFASSLSFGAVSSVGTPGTFYANTNTGSSNITVPSGASVAVLGISGWSSTDANLYSGGSVTLNGNSCSVGRADDTTTATDFTAIFYCLSPPSGTQAVAWDWIGTNAPSDDSVVHYSFYAGVDVSSAIRSSGGQATTTTSASAGTLTAVSGDYIVAVSYGYANANPTDMTWTGPTEIDDFLSSGGLAVNRTSSAAGQATGDTAVSVSQSGGGITPYTTMSAIVLRQSAATIAIDINIGATQNSGVTSVTTASTSTAVAGELILVGCNASTTAGSITFTLPTSTDGSLTFSTATISTGGNGGAGWWYACADSAVASKTFTCNWVGNHEGSIQVVGLKGTGCLSAFQDLSIGAVNSCSGSVGTVASCSYTSTVDGSRGFFTGIDNANSGTITAPAGQTILATNSYNSTNAAKDWYSVNDSETSTAGTTVTMSANGTTSTTSSISDAIIEVTPFTHAITQEGFAFGDDDGNEASHTLGSQDTDFTGDLGSKTMRTLMDITGSTSTFTPSLRYQKNGAGGYADVPVGPIAQGQTSTISDSNLTKSGNNTASTSWAISVPAASAGDLLIVNLNWDDSTTTTDASLANGPNGETANVIAGPIASNSTSNRAKSWYYLATGSWSAGTVTATPTASEQWTATVIKMAAGGFDASTPIGASASTASVTTGNPGCPAFSAGASDGGGRIFCYIAGDTDDPDGTVSGWTSLTTTDRGAVGDGVVFRDSTASDSESIPFQTGWTFPSARAWASIGYIVRPPPDSDNEIFVSTSANIASGGEATTARLSAPSGKTTGDFATGRRWDDENGTDSIAFNNDEYTELEWTVTIRSPGTTDDYYEFRTYVDGSPAYSYAVTPKWTIGTVTPPPSGEQRPIKFWMVN